ncbi:hypothetical protein [Pradoshia sp.]
MKLISILLMILGIVGILLSFMMFGDIGIAAFIGSLAALLSGIGFWQAHKALHLPSKQ